MYTYIHICISIYTYVYLCVPIYTYVYLYAPTCTYTHLYPFSIDSRSQAYTHAPQIHTIRMHTQYTPQAHTATHHKVIPLTPCTISCCATSCNHALSMGRVRGPLGRSSWALLTRVVVPVRGPVHQSTWYCRSSGLMGGGGSVRGFRVGCEEGVVGWCWLVGWVCVGVWACDVWDIV